MRRYTARIKRAIYLAKIKSPPRQAATPKGVKKQQAGEGVYSQ